MIRKRTEKVLAWLLTLALVVGSFVSFPAKAATSTIWEVKVQKTEISGKGGNVEVNVRGENLGSQVWYKISTKVDGMPVKLVDHTAVDCPGSNGGNIQIPIPANTGDTARKLTISITDTDNKFGSYVKADKEITQPQQKNRLWRQQQTFRKPLMIWRLQKEQETHQISVQL